LKATSRQRWRHVSFFVLVAAVAALGHSLRANRAQSAALEPSARGVPRLEGRLIRYSADYARRSQIDFARAAVTQLEPTVNVTGTVAFDPELTVALGARVTGRMRRICKLEGDTVRRGDVLAEIESVDLGKAEAGLTTALARVNAANANERRELELAEAQISSQRAAELAVLAATTARAELVAAEERVRALGGPTGAGIGILKIVTPIAGKVVERHVSRGQFVEATMTAFRVADLSRLWVQLGVFERQVGSIHEGDPVDIYPQAQSKQPIKGRVAYVGDVIDLETRTAVVRVVVDDRHGHMRPGESALAKVHTSRRAAALVVPRAAVTTVDGRPTVFVAADPFSVEPRVVSLGEQDATQIEIVNGLSEGEKVATSGVFLLKSELFR
jgi:cobalt-zinc-cadmium efflux system membrane fusion protein